MNRQCPYGTVREPGVDSHWHQFRSGHAPLPVQLDDGDRFTPDHVGWNWRANEAKQTLPVILKDEAGREIVLTTLSLASEGRLATVLL